MHTNRLIHETSPYLLQHAHNPVDWYAWGPEAFAAARSENKPIFLSVGYSTCYWCHVMERECFENETIAAEMNRLFINIKVDREERPDVDSLYMTAVQVLTRQGGWPMSVFLTPELKPFYGGTYFPPSDMHGRPGFPRVLAGIAEAYHTRGEDVAQATAQLVDILQQVARPAAPSGSLTLDRAMVAALIERSTGDYDARHGGFGAAPKFPRQTLLELLLVYHRYYPDADVLRMVRHSLDAMAAGGIHDHLGGGFHRYSTDAQWLVPHFEIMLYDNALLAWVYVEAYKQTEEPRYAQVARGILDFVLREMTDAHGGFYTAFDAEADAHEGRPYLWTADEIDALLGPDAAVFKRAYGLDSGPNFADPHHGAGRPESNVLYLPEPVDAALEPTLARCRQVLYEARRKRTQPALDTKILTAWNALMVRAMARGGQVLNEPRYTEAGVRAAEFLLAHHRAPDGALYRTSRADGPARLPASLDDYAYLCEALLALQDATGDGRWKPRAEELFAVMCGQFEDTLAGGFYFTAEGAADLIVRQKIGSDSPLPSGNAVAARVAVALDSPERAEKTLAVFAGQLEHGAEGMSAMVQAATLYLLSRPPIRVFAGAEAADRPSTPQELAQRVVDVRAEWAGPTELQLHLSILRGFHINAHEAAADMVPLQVTAQGAAVEYPPGTEPLRVHEGRVTVVLRFADAVTRDVPVTISYQACDDRACLPGVSKRLIVPRPE